VAKLARELDGTVITPSSSGYVAARELWDKRFDSLQPRAIAYCANAEDVQRVVNWGRQNNVRIVPRSGRHSYAGYSSGDGVVVADVSNLTHVQVAGRTAKIGAGTKLIDVYAKLWQHGVTIPAGSCPTIGIAGLALGGGHGFSSRKFGTTSDNIRGVHIVTADGRRLACDSSDHADLFWACRGGGGGNFGIVTELDFATHPVTNVSRFTIAWPWAQAAQAVAAWQSFAPHAPDGLFSGFGLVASTKTAQAYVGASGQYFGSASALRSLIEPLSSTGTPISVFTEDLSYMEAVLHEAGCHDPTACAKGSRSTFKAKSDYVNAPLSSTAISHLVDAIATRQGKGRGAIYMDAYGGAINRVAPDATAFVHRHALFSVQYTAEWDGSSAQSVRWLDGLYSRMRPFVSGLSYVNYIDPELANWQHAYYGKNLPRLKAVKRKYDPHDAFRFKQSIPLR
jgi:FAD/FMN-containing dehydrogenase